MSIEKYETKAGIRWCVQYYKPDGTKSRKRNFRTKRAATQWELETITAIKKGVWIDPKKGEITFGQLGDEWIKRQTHLKPSSLRDLTTSWESRVKPYWGNRPIGSIRHTEVQSWISNLTNMRNGRPLSPTGKAYALQCIHNILADAVRDGLIPTNPALEVKVPPKVRKNARYLTIQELRSLAAAVGQYEALILILGACGLRWGEAIALTPADIDFLRRRISITKNAVWVGTKVEVGSPKTWENRTVPIPEFLIPPLDKAMRGKPPSALIFTNRNGGYLKRPSTRDGWWARALKDAAIEPLTAHELRHTCASLAVRAGASVKALQAMLGHRSAAMTLDVYADLFDDELDSVAAALSALAENS